jgi:hydroxyethylthiazole kinase
MNAHLSAEPLAGLLAVLRERSPLVQCLTNTVVTNFTANVLLAAGAAPAMVDVPGEAGPFARVAAGVLVNVGTPHAEQREAMVEAAEWASDAGTPWVLDPVAVGVLPVRTALARRLLALRPAIVRGNPSEIKALAGFSAGGRGTDSTDSPEDAIQAARHLALEYGPVVAISGPVDLVTDGRREVSVDNGHQHLTRITGGGCALGALTAAFASLDTDALSAAVAATGFYTVAAELAAAGAAGPGTFQPMLLDRLHSLTVAEFGERLQLR